MGAARGSEAAMWTQAVTGVAVRRPSWLSPAVKVAAGERARVALSIVPRAAHADAKADASADADADANANAEADADENADADADAKAKADADADAKAEDALRSAAMRAMEGEIEALRGTAAELAATLATLRRRTLEASEGELVGLAMAIAKRVVGEAISAEPGRVAGWAREAIATLPARETMVVAISTDLAERVAESAWTEACGSHRIEVDVSLPAATCEVRVGAATVEVSAEARLAAVGEAIGAGT